MWDTQEMCEVLSRVTCLNQLTATVPVIMPAHATERRNGIQERMYGRRMLVTV